MDSRVARVTMTSIQQSLRGELDAVFGELRRMVQADFPLVNQVNEHLLRIRGKMFRPTLLLLAAQSVGQIGRRELTLGAILELIHIATLVHDDSVDHSPLRRGQPTVNAEFSHEIAVIMGDYLYSRAIEKLVQLDSLEPLRIMSRVTNELTIGEMREVVAHDVLSFTQDDYEQLIRAKTASLMAGACELGALVGDDEFREPLKQYGLSLGSAFQIADDLLDYTAAESATGKPSSQDLREHKITLPLIAALQHMTSAEKQQVEDLMANQTPDTDEINAIIRIVEVRGGIAAARERAQELALQAEAELAVIPPGRARDALRDCIMYSIERRR
ncbi:MAG: polyprenyl synthetase family protein [Gemmatimonadota bacterium]|nr:MAG: polyprenyl synthetase family protein [Gemmatimonadota bacterium]